MLIGSLAAAAVGLVAVLLTPGTVAGRGHEQQEPPPTAAHTIEVHDVGPLFVRGLGQPHSCSASVLRSSGHDLVLTAAHCVSGTGAGILFVPGYDDGRAPYGVWTVVRAYVDPSWLARQDPQRDYAILQVAAQRWRGRQRNVQDAVAGARLGTAPHAGSVVRVTAYVAGLGDRSVSCTAVVRTTHGFPTFTCHGYPGGTSGAPWVSAGGSAPTPSTVGVIGGLHQGGCAEHTSYSSAFDTDTVRLLLRAEAGGPGDTLPAPDDDGC